MHAHHDADDSEAGDGGAELGDDPVEGFGGGPGVEEQADGDGEAGGQGYKEGEAVFWF